MSPKYVFRIDEIRENPTSPVMVNRHGHWEPSADQHGSIRCSTADGVTGRFWYCNGQNITPLPAQYVAGNLVQHHSFSLYYCDGYGFWVLQGDATGDPGQQPWRPLTFEHDTQNYSSYVTNAGTQSRLRCQRPDQNWPRMLLPDIYHAPPTAQSVHQTYGGLKGDLGLFLGLVAFSMNSSHLNQYLGWMFQGGRWQVHNLPHGRSHKRGVVVYVYPFPPDTSADLSHYQNGELGLFYP